MICVSTIHSLSPCYIQLSVHSNQTKLPIEWRPKWYKRIRHSQRMAYFTSLPLCDVRTWLCKQRRADQQQPGTRAFTALNGKHSLEYTLEKRAMDASTRQVHVVNCYHSNWLPDRALNGTCMQLQHWTALKPVVLISGCQKYNLETSDRTKGWIVNRTTMTLGMPTSN